MVFHCSKWCEMDFVHPQYGYLFLGVIPRAEIGVTRFFLWRLLRARFLAQRFAGRHLGLLLLKHMLLVSPVGVKGAHFLSS